MPDPWSTLSNLVLAEGVRAAVGKLTEDTRVVVVILDDHRDYEYDVVGSSYDSRANIVRIQIERTRD